MKIDSGLSGYNYPNRSQEIERKIDDAPARETPTFQRSPNAITGSSTFLSQSLSNALWVMETGEAGSATPPAVIAQDWVENRYQEFSEF
jgi:hypothetical protein